MTSSNGKTSATSAPTVRLIMCATLLASAMVLTSCIDDREALTLNEPQRRHAIEFADRTEKLFVELVPRGNGLSENQHVDVVRFLGRYKAESTSRLKVVAAAGPGEHGAAERSVRDVRVLAFEAGIPIRAVAVEYRRSPAARGALQISYERPVAVPPVCEDWSEDLGHNRDRVNYPNFGCATQRSLGLMVANPRDLLEPRAEVPRGSERRESTWSSYVKGAAGSSAPAASPGAAPNTPAPATK